MSPSPVSANDAHGSTRAARRLARRPAWPRAMLVVAAVIVSCHEDATDVAAGRDAASPVLDGTADGAAGGTAATSPCRALAQEARSAAVEAEAVADRRCSTEADCVLTRADVPCAHSCSRGVAATTTSGAELEALAEAARRQHCDPFETAGCTVDRPTCPDTTGAVNCVDGTCVAMDEHDCDACVDAELSWADTGFIEGPRRRLVACRTYEFETFEGRCATDLPGCAEVAEIRLDDVLRAVEHPDVRSALAEGGFIGSETTILSAPFFSVTWRGQSFMTGEQCRAIEQACHWVPDGVLELVALLRRLDAQQQCAIEPAPP